MKFTIFQESRRGRRANNEDRLGYCYSRDALLMVVADGMGGHYYGEIAAQIAVQTLTGAFQREALPQLQDPFLFLQKAISNAHSAIRDYSSEQRLNDSPRTTVVACIVQDNVAYWAHAGDSRLYLMRDGRMLARTRDHSRVQLLIDQGAISEAQATSHPERNRIWSCLGGEQAPEIEFSRKTPLENGDVLVLCSDGVWGPMPGELMAMSLKDANLMQAVPMLLSQAEVRAGTHADNLSMIAVRWEDSYFDQTTSAVSTKTMPIDAITTHLDQFGRNPAYKSELTDDEIERAIAEINHAIQKFSK
ncbi:PP2C family protein-serine/threonine phosphatase [Rhodocyclus tenuis]|uniref:Serine/threonine protein phosphatase PrpC n=1 Tax=Rhodocyclus tenuis TaxID=1066 RepID=A0A840FXD6_RHOTE|nr:protein phosphatase 2C domain-containing protein [Rhodocyclus tenuis]MBB4246454.1 serine/threonine protein phosphatase PrpC [Rhodocyclus tenuis]